MKSLASLLIFIILSSGSLFSQSSVENIYNGNVLEFESRILKEKKNIYVHLPKDYENKNYPTFYLISSSPNDFKASILQNQFIIVGIENNETKNYFAEQVSRNNYFNFLEKELIPFVETKFNANSIRFISGHSISGGFVIDVFNKFPDSFSFYIATSPAVQMLNLEVSSLVLPKPVCLYFNIGSRENYKQLEKANDDLFDALDSLKIKNLNWKYEILADETHETNEFSGFCRGYTFYKSFSTIPDSLLSKNIYSIVEYVNNLSNQLGNKIEIGEYVFMPNILINLDAKNYNNVISTFEYIAKEDPDFLINQSSAMIDIAADIQNNGNETIARQAYQIIFDKTKSEVAKEKMNELDKKNGN